jgi:hypothetical protein
MRSFEKELEELINKYSKENDSDTPDFILATYISECLIAYARAVNDRDEWYKFKPLNVDAIASESISELVEKLLDENGWDLKFIHMFDTTAKIFRKELIKAIASNLLRPEITVTGTESLVCKDIADRQRKGIKKYKKTVAENPLSQKEWLQHAYEECLDMSIYLKAAMAAELK